MTFIVTFCNVLIVTLVERLTVFVTRAYCLNFEAVTRAYCLNFEALTFLKILSTGLRITCLTDNSMSAVRGKYRCGNSSQQVFHRDHYWVKPYF